MRGGKGAAATNDAGLGGCMVLVILMCLGFLLGVGLLVLGWRGRRVDDHPVCRRCGYDLTGMMPGRRHNRCAVCGTVLWWRGVRRGNRAEHGVLMWTGLLLALPCVLGGALLVAAAARGVELLRYAPDGYVIYRAQSGDGSEEARAFAELNRRAARRGGEAIVERALAIQGDPEVEWDSRWGDVAETAERAGVMSRGQWERYLGQVLRFSERVRPRVGWGEDVLVDLEEPEFRCGSGLTVDVSSQVTLKWGDFSITSSCPDASIRSPSRHWFGLNPGRIEFLAEDKERVGVGRREMTMVHRWEVRATGVFVGTGRGRLETQVRLEILPEGEASQGVPEEGKNPR